ncbi:hypothetical protein ERJ75_000805200 [Trypanosoma vivax]|nr:hypothetical protein ERJ75_000805200 [Trypanosoma vivax]
MRQPRTQVLRSDAKAVSTRVAEGNLALTTEEREEARGPRDLAKLDRRGQRAAGPTGKRDERRAAGDKASTHACCRDARRGASVADRRRGATYGKGAGAARRGTTGRRGRGKATWGVRGGKRAAARTAIARRGRGTGPGSGEDAERNAGGKKQLV